jgi:hypothetical protein
MPEASVHGCHSDRREESRSELGKNKIRSAKHRRMTTPSGNPLAAEEPHQGHFRFFVSATTDARHHLRSLGFGENVRHFVAAVYDRRI